MITKLLVLFSLTATSITAKGRYEDVRGLFLRNNNLIKELKRDKVDENCLKDMVNLFDSFNQEKDWAERVFDSWGSMPSGRYHGNTIHYGHFEQCIEINVNPFEPQFCLIPINKKNESSFIHSKIGLCVPSSCSKYSLQKITQRVLTATEYESVDTDIRCTDNKYRDWGTFEYTAIIIVVFFTGLVLFSTGYEGYCYYTGRKVQKECTAFSLVRNVPSLMSTESKNDIFECLNALRVVTMVWIVIMHIFFYLTDFMQTMHNTKHYKEWQKTMLYTIIVQSQLGADLYLVISGLCLGNSFFKARNRGEKFKLWDYYLHRYIRLSPAKIAAMVFSIFMFNVKYGPVYDLSHWLARKEDTCRTWWWAGLLYSQNYINPLNPCLPPTWYQHVDIHMFVISPLLFFGLWKFGYLFMPLVLGIISIANYSVYELSRDNKFDLHPLHLDYFQKLYVKTHTRFSPWIIGALLAYIIFRQQESKKRLSTRTQLIIWCLMLPNLVNSFIGPWLFADLNDNLLFTSIMHPLHRIIWVLPICWIIYACAIGYATPLNWFLSHSCWKPLVKLNYGIFLVHQALITVLARLLRNEMTFHGYIFTMIGLGTYFAALVVAIPITLMFEMPFINLEKDVKEFLRKRNILVVQKNGKKIN